MATPAPPPGFEIIPDGPSPAPPPGFVLVEPPQVGHAEGLMRHFGQGMSLNFMDELQAGKDAAIARGYEGQGVLGATAAGLERAHPVGMLVGLAKDMLQRDPEYLKRLERERARTDAYEKENPGKATAASIAGGLATAIAPVGAGAQAAGRTAMTVGRMVRSGALQGAVQGAISGFGGAVSPDQATTAQDLTARAEAATGGGIVGGVLGGVGGYVGSKLGRIVGGIQAARAETATPRTAADAVLGRTLERDRITPQQLITSIERDLPRSSERDARLALSQPQVERLLALNRDGRSVREIAADLGVSEGVVRGRLREAETQMLTPLSLVDRSLMDGAGRGQNVLWKMKGAASTPGEARAIAHETFIERQMGAGERLSQAIRTHVAPGDIEGSVAQRMTAMRQAERDSYEAAFRAEQPFDIAPSLDRVIARFRGRHGELSEGMTRAVALFERPVQIMSDDGARVAATELQRVNTLRGFLDAKQELDQMIERSFGQRGPTQLTRELQRLKTDLMEQVSSTNPVWRAANDFFADGRSAERMLDMGQRAALRLNGGMREVLDEWRRLGDVTSIRRRELLTPAQIRDVVELRRDLFREGLSRALQDRVMNRQVTHDLTAELRTPAARKILTTVLGRDRAAALLRVADQEFTALRSQRALFGSQTAGLHGEQADLSWAPRVASMAEYLNPRKAADLVAERVAGAVTQRQNEQLMRMLSTMDPIEQLAILRRLQATAAARAQGVQAFGPWGPAATASVVNPLMRQDQPRNPLQRR